MTTLTDILIDQKKQQEKYFANPAFWAGEIKKHILKILPDAKVFLFGSVVEGKATPASDIDVLITSVTMPKRQEDRAKIKAKIWQKIGLSSPFEIHMVDTQQFLWYQRFARLIEV